MSHPRDSPISSDLGQMIRIHSCRTAARKCILVIFCIFMFVIYRFMGKNYEVVDSEIVQYLRYAEITQGEPCPALPNFENTTWAKMVTEFPDDAYNETELAKNLALGPGGTWAPTNCTPLHEVVLIVPYRNREVQRKIFLRYMHDFLQKQLISYRIVIVEQAPGKSFNRGKLMNIGFHEMSRRYRYPCYIFHDVDLLPQVLNNIYGCTSLPRHMSASINVRNYALYYDNWFGGVTSMLAEQFEAANGFSNIYWGWGSEDDDLLVRVRKSGLDLIRFSQNISRYFMLYHEPEEKNPERKNLYLSGGERVATDGLNSLQYELLSFQELPLYTHLKVLP